MGQNLPLHRGWKGNSSFPHQPCTNFLGLTQVAKHSHWGASVIRAVVQSVFCNGVHKNYTSFQIFTSLLDPGITVQLWYTDHLKVGEGQKQLPVRSQTLHLPDHWCMIFIHHRQSGKPHFFCFFDSYQLNIWRHIRFKVNPKNSRKYSGREICLRPVSAGSVSLTPELTWAIFSLFGWPF